MHTFVEDGIVMSKFIGGECMEENFIHEIIHKAEETKDDFIFTTISRFMGQDTVMSTIPMSKQILCRALICFRQEHSDEYYQLLDESYERRERTD